MLGPVLGRHLKIRPCQNQTGFNNLITLLVQYSNPYCKFCIETSKVSILNPQNK